MTNSSRISTTFQNLKSAGRMAFMPFITAGDPHMDATIRLIRRLGAAGVDLIEVGFPYSDPIADGPVIQASYTRALDKKLHVDDIFQAVAALGAERDSLPPLVAMVSFAIIFRIGGEQFLEKASQAGFSGLIVPDLPGDEAEEFAQVVAKYPLDLVQLVAPTTPDDRIEKIVNSASGFLYCISVAGTTGARDELPPELNAQLKDLRSRTNLPLAVGFGISKPEQADVLRGHADGLIVGSAIVRYLESVTDEKSLDAALEQIGQFADRMCDAVH
ncbi:MAG TPA: tryptophan synthase subunit alpha [Planctomycetaceae bacterium]|nr:tryptophan synthase subunit alpha [Planctomycetaceae bacterium]